ncbi:hypothetical protein ACLOAV_000999 [Pseudogymnoascus australis]
MPSIRPSSQEPLAVGLAQDQNKQEYVKFYAKNLASRETVATTTCPSGQVIDWVNAESRGEIATPPPPLDPSMRKQAHDATIPTGSPPKTELEVHERLRGPPGTVPVLRQSLALADFSKPISSILSKTGPPDSSGRISIRATDPNKHLYASSAQNVKHYGGEGEFSMYNPYVETKSDFSLTQLAVIHRTGAHDPSHPAVDGRQTVEAGLINHPARFGDSNLHLFTFFTTVGYARYGDFIQSWNEDYKGWVQVDNTIFPGTVCSTLSTENGIQYNLWIAYQLDDGKWWLWVKDRWIGYYPASMFGAGNTLASHSDRVAFYGEVVDSTEVADPTTTDMGSGNFPETGWNHSAYISDMMYQAQPTSISTDLTDFDGSGDIIMDDPAKYRMQPHFKSGQYWGSYAWLGGPGAGGIVGH